MKRFLLLALFLTSTSLGLVGCSETAKEETKTTKETPGGSSTTTTTTETKATGDQKPVTETPK